MKKNLKLLSLSLFLLLLFIPATALALDPPEVDEVPEYVDAEMYLITGTAEPNSTVSIIGGQYNLAPTIADSNGNFELFVSLIQNQENTFYLRTTVDDETSERTEITINEDKKEAENLGKEGIDVIAPESPEIDDFPSQTDELVIILTGTGEPQASIIAKSDFGDTVDDIADDGSFSLQLNLTHNYENKFDVYVKDASENISEYVNVDITNGNPELYQPIAAPFTDIEGHWAYDYIEYLRLAGIISGYEDGTFGPNNPLTRAEMTKIAMVAFGYMENSQYFGDPSDLFTDINDNEWYSQYIMAAKLERIVEGYPDNTFRPLSNISRVEALKILLEAGEIEVGTFANIKFDDTELGQWYSPYISYAVENGIVQGYDGNLFKPEQNITRAEICKITVKVMELKGMIDSIPSI